MFQQNIGTKELVDALRLSCRALSLIPNQPIPRATDNDFKETAMAADYLWHLISAVEGMKSAFDLIQLEHQARANRDVVDVRKAA